MDSVRKAWTIWEGRLLQNDPARIRPTARLHRRQAGRGCELLTLQRVDSRQGRGRKRIHEPQAPQQPPRPPRPPPCARAVLLCPAVWKAWDTPAWDTPAKVTDAGLSPRPQETDANCRRTIVVHLRYEECLTPSVYHACLRCSKHKGCRRFRFDSGALTLFPSSRFYVLQSPRGAFLGMERPRLERGD